LSGGSGNGNKADDGTGETDGGHENENKAIIYITVGLPIVLRDKKARDELRT
jgi:hypothetical protein